MGAFCTRTICNIEKGDENYSKLLDRRNNMDSKSDIPENDEMPIMDTNEPSISSPISGEKSKEKRSSRHVPVPTPSMREIQTAMDNMHILFTPGTANADNESDDNSSDDNKESTPTLPTMAYDVSNLKLANPFGGMTPLSDRDNGNKVQSAYAGIASLPPIPDQNGNGNGNNNGNGGHQSEISSDLLSVNDGSNIAPADDVNNGGHDKQPTIEDLFGGNGAVLGGTVVIHGDDKQDAATKLQLQCEQEGSNGLQDETDFVSFKPSPSPPDGSKGNKGGLDVEKKGGDVMANKSSMKIGDVEEEQEIEKEKENKVKVEVEDKSKNEDVGKKKNVQFKVNVQPPDTTEDDDNNDKNENENVLSPPDQVLSPSDYETSEIESADSLRGEDENDEVNERGTKRRGSKTQKENQKVLTLSYDETTLNDESTSEDEDDEDVQTKNALNLYREKSRYKWKRKDVSKHEKMIKAELEKLKMEQEMAEMNNVMTFYKQQSIQQ